MAGSRPGSSSSSNGGAGHSKKPVYNKGPKSGKKLLSVKDMDTAFEHLDQELGLNEFSAAIAPIRMVTLGGSIAVKTFKSRAATVDVDVIVDPNIEAVSEFYDAVMWCIEKVAKKNKLEKNWMNDQCKMFFQKGAVRERVFLESVGHDNKMYSGKHLEIYTVDLRIALERKLRRVLDPDREENIDLADAVCFLKHMTSYGTRPLGIHQCQSMDYNGHKLPVPNEAIRMVQQRFEKNEDNDPQIQGKQGIVEMVFDKNQNKWYYKNKQGQTVWVTWKLE
ncbi:hypothetical protein DHEL01_v204062 [Diaporthe helianthi]|uniref:Uncharacterized protein n=1 Tax=Diaporthe helianthi TaxID=158607 RepID=A0A2P5I4Z4_DIAHE|nr:hypothetical protein DHEL01_v204062 [Diaporthe helianthi]